MMTAAQQLEFVTVAEYLTGEVEAATKHEYLGGYVYAMAGGSVAHNRIASNLLGTLFGRLKGNPCQPFNSDMKVRIQFPSHTRFYYPDVSIICDSNPSQDSYQDRPVVLIEVLSSDTRRSDETEKKDAYLSIPSLKGYLLVEQQSSKVSVYRRQNEGFVGEVYQGTEAIVQVPGFDITLPLSEVYTGIQFDSDPSHSQMP